MAEKAPESGVAPIEKREKRERWHMAARSVAKGHPSRNEDTYIADEELGLMGVFDGVGGHVGGQAASQAAALKVFEEVMRWGPIEDAKADTIRSSLANILRAAEKAVVSKGDELFLGIPEGERKKEQSPQTTATIAKLHEFADHRILLAVAHVGNCRLYIRRLSGALEQITEDDDFLAEEHGPEMIRVMFGRELSEADIARYRALLDAAATEDEMPDAIGKYLFRHNNIISEALGSKRRSKPLSVHTYETLVMPGELIIDISDGMQNLTQARIADLAAQIGDPDDLADHLVQEAYEYSQLPRSKGDDGPKTRSHRDDITVVVAKV